MALSDIPKPNPVVIPATTEKIYDKQYCVSLFVDTQPNKPWSARFTGVPYNGTDILKDGTSNSIKLHDLKALATVDESLSAALQSVLVCIGKYLVACDILNVKEVTMENVNQVLAVIPSSEE